MLKIAGNNAGTVQESQYSEEGTWTSSYKELRTQTVLLQYQMTSFLPPQQNLRNEMGNNL